MTKSTPCLLLLPNPARTHVGRHQLGSPFAPLSPKPTADLATSITPSAPHTGFAAERVIRFVNLLPCTAGPLAGKPLKLRPWQKRFIRAVYRTDKAGNRLVRTAVLSVARKNGRLDLAGRLCLCCRDSATSNRHRRFVTSGRTRSKLSGRLQRPSFQRAGRKTTPSGTTPCRTSRRRAIRSLRAKATIMGLRAPRASSVRDRNHCAKALSFWYMRNRHANWTMPRRTRPLPERASPFLRRFLPLSSGEPVRPA